MARGRSLMGDNGIVSTLLVAVVAGTAKDDAVAIGAALTGVALTDRDANGNAVIAIAPSQVMRINVVGSTDVDTSPLSAASAVAIGDILYCEAGSEVVSKDSDDVRIGVALGTRDENGAYTAAADAVESGATSECDVLLG